MNCDHDQNTPWLGCRIFAVGFIALAVVNSHSSDIWADEVASWKFAAERLDNGRIQPTRGALPATLVGKTVWNKEKPYALQLDGRSNRVVLAEAAPQPPVHSEANHAFQTLLVS